VSDLIGIGRDPHFVEVRSDRRFQALVQRVGVRYNDKKSCSAFRASAKESYVAMPDVCCPVDGCFL